MAKSRAHRIIEVLGEFVSDHKKKIIDTVLINRTRHLTLVFEDIDKPHNISAVIRTAECLGIQDIHFIKNRNDYSVNTAIAQGAAKWLTFHHHRNKENNVDACYQLLRANNYKIYATSLHERSMPIHDIDLSEKVAIVFGTEAEGISNEAGQKADGYVYVPMKGFTESFNLSVSAALCMNTLAGEMGFPVISGEEQDELRAEWYRKIVREADLILKNKGV